MTGKALSPRRLRRRWPGSSSGRCAPSSRAGRRSGPRRPYEGFTDGVPHRARRRVPLQGDRARPRARRAPGSRATCGRAARSPGATGRSATASSTTRHGSFTQPVGQPYIKSTAIYQTSGPAPLHARAAGAAADRQRRLRAEPPRPRRLPLRGAGPRPAGGRGEALRGHLRRVRAILRRPHHRRQHPAGRHQPAGHGRWTSPCSPVQQVSYVGQSIAMVLADDRAGSDPHRRVRLRASAWRTPRIGTCAVEPAAVERADPRRAGRHPGRQHLSRRARPRRRTSRTSGRSPGPAASSTGPADQRPAATGKIVTRETSDRQRALHWWSRAPSSPAARCTSTWSPRPASPLR